MQSFVLAWEQTYSAEQKIHRRQDRIYRGLDKVHHPDGLREDAVSLSVLDLYSLLP